MPSLGPGMVRFMCCLSQAVVSVIQSNAYLGVAVKAFVDMVNLCVRLPVTKTTTSRNVWATPTQLKDFGRKTEVSTKKEEVCLWTAVWAPGASSPAP